jgi:hypothetical protein
MRKGDVRILRARSETRFAEEPGRIDDAHGHGGAHRRGVDLALHGSLAALRAVLRRLARAADGVDDRDTTTTQLSSDLVSSRE